MKTLFLLTLLFLSHDSNSQIINCDSIPWSNTIKLRWTDFKAQPDTTSEYGAISRISIAYKLTQVNDIVKIVVKCFFNPCISWRKSTSNDKTGLLHEQSHFDIAQYFKRLFIKRILEKQFSRQNFLKEVKDIYTTIASERASEDKKYDEKTDYSRNKQEQFRMTEKYKKMIESLKGFDKTSIQFILRN